MHVLVIQGSKPTGLRLSLLT